MADLSKIKLNGVEYDLKDSFAREAIANIPEDKIFPVNVTLTSITEGTSDKSHTEILAAVNAGKIPFVYIDYSGIKMIAPLTRIESNYSVFTYEDQSAENLNYACLKIQNSTATIIWRDGYITQDDLPTLSSVATSGDYNDLTNKPTIPAAQVNADWDATSGVAQILHKPTIPTVPTNVSAFTNDSGYLTSYTETDPTVPAWAKAESKPTYTAAEVGALPADTIIPTVPTNVSAFTNDAGYLTSYTETDPTVPSWAKASAKPTYTASEVGAAASSHVHGNVKNDGTITVNTSMANGDRLLFSDTSDSSKIKNSNITIGTSTTQYLANNGTWQNLPTVSVSQTLTSGTEIGSVNNTKLYAPAPYNDSALAARVTALEQLEWATYYSGRSNPSNSQGQNGDIYLQY